MRCPLLRLLLACGLYVVASLPTPQQVESAAPPRSAQSSAPLTARQQERLRVRDRLKQEVQQLMARIDKGDPQGITHSATFAWSSTPKTVPDVVVALWVTQWPSAATRAQLRQATQQLTTIVAIEKEVLGTHRETAESLTILGRTWERLEVFALAEQLRKEAHDMLVVLFPPYHPEHWQVTDADLAVKHLAQLKKMTANQQIQYRELKELGRQIDVVARSKNWPRSVILARKQRAITRSLFGESHRDYATSSQTLAVFLDFNNQPDEAEPLYREALDLRRKLLGNRHPFFADTCRDLASLLTDKAKLADSQGKHREASEIRLEEIALLSEIYGPKDWRVTDARFVRDLATIKSTWGEQERRKFLQLDAMYKKIGQLLATSDDRGALELTQQYVTGVYNLFPAGHRYRGLANNVVALGYQTQGNLQAARGAFTTQVDENRQSLGDHPDTATALENLAGVESDLNDIPASYRHYREAKQIFDRCPGKNLERYGQFLNNYAIFLTRLGLFEASESVLQEALQISESVQHSTQASRLKLLGDFAVLRQRQGRFLEAERRFLEVRDNAQRAGLTKLPFYRTLLHNLASFYAELGKRAAGDGRPQEAKGYFQRGVQMARALLGAAYDRDTPGLSKDRETLNLLGVLLQNLGEYAEAEKIFLSLDKALPADGWRRRDGRSNLAAFYQITRQPAKAIHLATDAITDKERFLQSALPGLSNSQRVTFLETLRDTLFGYLSVAVDGGVPADQIYGHALAWKGAAFARQADERVLRDHPKLKEIYSDLARARFRYTNVATSEPDPVQHNAWRKRLLALRGEKEQLERQFTAAVTEPDVRDFLQRAAPLRILQASDVANALPEGCVLLDFVEYTHFSPPPGTGPLRQEKRLLVFVLRRGAPVQCVPLIHSATVGSLVEQWQAALQFRYESDPGRSRPTADLELINRPREIAACLFPPLKKYLADAQTLLVAPDGPLCRIPFAIFPSLKGNTYLLQDFPIGYVTSGRHAVEALQATRKTAEDGLLGVGGIDYGMTPVESGIRSGLSYLTDSLDEVNASEKLYREAFPQARLPVLLTGAKVDKERALQELRAGPRHVHWAGHAFYGHPLRALSIGSGLRAASRSPKAESGDDVGFDPFLFSGIPLAGANSRGAWYNLDNIQSTTLTAEDINGLDLRRTQTVVLSACQTGLGEVATGEGVLGLQRSFHHAGVSTLVTSHWQVPSSTTSKLMAKFYGYLWGKNPCGPLRAMQLAQLDMLKSREGNTEHYYHWAAWTVAGDPGRLAAPISEPEPADLIPSVTEAKTPQPLPEVPSGLSMGTVLVGACSVGLVFALGYFAGRRKT